MKFLSLSVRNFICILLVYFSYLLITNKLFKHINIEINTIQSQPSTDQQLKEIANTQVTPLFLDKSSLEKPNEGWLVESFSDQGRHDGQFTIFPH